MTKKTVIQLALMSGMCVSIFCSGLCSFMQKRNEITHGVFRLHILANSDSTEDQQLKLKVRDNILEKTAYIFENSSYAEASNTASDSISLIQSVAEETIASEGYAYPVTCEIAQVYFDAREYGSITMPQGEYTALRILIGNGEGKNWWCVMYPPLCLPAVTNIDEALDDCGDTFTKEEIEMLKNPQNYEVRFYFAELFEKLESYLEEWAEKHNNTKS